MLSYLLGALSHRRAALAEKDKGFTLIELLVVVIIIGILAAVAIPVYLNVQNGAKDSAMESDLTNAKTAVVSAQTQHATGALPANDGEFNNIFPSNPGLTYTTNGTDKFCIEGTSASGATFAIDTDTSVIAGTCNATFDAAP